MKKKPFIQFSLTNSDLDFMGVFYGPTGMSKNQTRTNAKPMFFYHILISAVIETTLCTFIKINVQENISSERHKQGIA